MPEWCKVDVFESEISNDEKAFYWLSFGDLCYYLMQLIQLFGDWNFYLHHFRLSATLPSGTLIMTFNYRTFTFAKSRRFQTFGGRPGSVLLLLNGISLRENVILAWFVGSFLSYDIITHHSLRWPIRALEYSGTFTEKDTLDKSKLKCFKLLITYRWNVSLWRDRLCRIEFFHLSRLSLRQIVGNSSSIRSYISCRVILLLSLKWL